VRKAYLAAAAVLFGALFISAAPAQAAETCNGLPVTKTGTAGNDTLFGTPGSDVISTGAGNDIVAALGGNDTVCLGPGDDLLDGGDGTDTMVADAAPDGRDVFVGNSSGAVGDFDLVSYAARTTPVTVTLDGNGDDGAAGEGDNIGTDVQAVQGGSAADVITAAPAGPQTNLRGGAGNDTISGNFSLAGDAGNDKLTFTGTGSGSLFGGDGADTLTGGPVQDDLSGGNGKDRITAGGGDDEIFGGPGDDVLNGLDGNDDLFGEDGNDELIGGLGNDTNIGGAGNDTADSLVARDGADSFSGGAGTDTASYAARQFGPTTTLTLSLNGVADDGEPGEGDNMATDVENAAGAVGSSVITGNSGPNVLRGGTGGDIIRGADGINGNDVVDGGFGFDTCTADPGDMKTCEA
jgi:Ca2+-binding RTX toxin-like protein